MTSNVALRRFFLRGSQTVMDCLWFRPIVKQKLAKQSVRRSTLPWLSMKIHKKIAEPTPRNKIQLQKLVSPD